MGELVPGGGNGATMLVKLQSTGSILFAVRPELFNVYVSRELGYMTATYLGQKKTALFACWVSQL